MRIEDLFKPRQFRYFKTADHVFIPIEHRGNEVLIDYAPLAVNESTPLRDGKYHSHQVWMELNAREPVDLDSAVETDFNGWCEGFLRWSNQKECH